MHHTYWLHCLYTGIKSLSERLTMCWQRIRIITRIPFRGWSEGPSVNRKLSSKVSVRRTKLLYLISLVGKITSAQLVIKMKNQSIQVAPVIGLKWWNA